MNKDHIGLFGITQNISNVRDKNSVPFISNWVFMTFIFVIAFSYRSRLHRGYSHLWLLSMCIAAAISSFQLVPRLPSYLGVHVCMCGCAQAPLHVLMDLS